MASQSMLAEAARELGSASYEPLAHLASGSFGDVFVVRHRDLGTELVLKLLKPEFKTQEDVVERLKVEARILTRVTHPNLIRVTDFGWARSGQPFLVTEKLEGETLQDRLKRERSIPLAEARDLAVQMLEALAIVHEARLVHRDIKPANLFLAARPGGGCTLKLLDFGIAKILDPDEGASLGRRIKTAEGMVLGTPAYLAPEQVLGRPVDARTDLYAAAGVVYRMLAGRPMFVVSSQDELILAHLQLVPEPVSKHATFAVPPEVDEAVAKGLEKDPAKRFQNAREFADALKAGPARASLPRTTVPLHLHQAAAAARAVAPTPAAAQPAVVSQDFLFKGESFEEGTVYATRRDTPGPPGTTPPAASEPRPFEPELVPLPQLASPVAPLPLATTRPYPRLLVPGLVITVALLLSAVIALTLMVLR